MDNGFYHDIAETTVDGVWVIDLEGRTLYANQALAAMFGASREEFGELTVFDTLDPEGRVQFAGHLEDLRAGRENGDSVEVLFVRRDGTTLWTLLSETILWDEDGGIRGVLHRVTDYDARRRHLDELTESRRQLAEAHAIARLGSWTLDAASGRLTVSDTLREIYGLPPEMELTFEGWLRAVHDDDRAAVELEVGTALREGCGFDFLARVEGANGFLWTRGLGVAHRDASGRVASLAGTHQDVTAQHETELALQHQLTRDALVQAVATSCNEARSLVEALADLQPVIRESAEWSDARTYLPDDGGDLMLLAADSDDDEDDLVLATRARDSGRTMWDDTGTVLAFPLLFRSRVHAVITLTAVAEPRHPTEILQAVHEAAALLSRVVEREQAERQLAAARDAAIRASQAKSEFLAVMSHEIRTPLNGVIGLNDLMLQTSLERRQRQLARGIRDAGRSLLRLINDVLDLSKIEAGQLELESVDFEVREVCDQAVQLMGDAARRSCVELAVACDPGVPEMLAGDPTRLGQVLSNLVSNAVKFTDEGHVLVRVSSARAGRRVRLRVDVSDTGAGIAPEALERIFDDFAQADASTTRQHGGTGLGLSISRRIVEALEGELTVTSTPGEGSTFSFTVLLDPPRGARTCPDDDAARARLAGGRVLVVSDGEARADLLRDQLALWHTRVDHVDDGTGAAAAVRLAHEEEDPFEAVLVDVPASRPHEGRETAELLASANAPRVFLVLTQRPDAAVVWAVRHATIEVLPKPVSSAALRGALLGQDSDGAVVSATTASLVRTDPCRVLVVEDNPVNQMVATGMLENLGYDVELAEDGIEAVERFDPARHHAVLMDVQMPRMDGYAATRALREKHAGGPRTPILAMTAAAVEGERERCLAAGMDDFLTKPVELNQIGAALARWMPTGPRSAASPVVEAQTVQMPTVATPVESVESVKLAPPGGADQPLPVLDTMRLEALGDLGPHAGTYLTSVIDRFVDGHEQLLADLRDAARGDDGEVLRHAAHKLAGSALNLGLSQVGIAARTLELSLDGDGADQPAGPLVDTLAEALARAVPALEEYREHHQQAVPQEAQ